MTVFIVPGVAMALWSLEMTDRVDVNFWYVLIAWISSVVMFITGVLIKNWFYSRQQD